MARAHEIGTPMGAERKSRRVGSPLQEMDGMNTEQDESRDHETWTRQPIFDVEPQTPPAARPEVTLEAIGLLLKAELAPVKETVDNLGRNLSDMKVSVDERFRMLQQTTESHTLRIQQLEQGGGGAATPESNASWTTQLTALEQELASLKKYWSGTDSAKTRPDESSCTAVIGGLDALPDLDAAKDWVSNKLWELYGPWTQEMYSKGNSVA